MQSEPKQPAFPVGLPPAGVPRADRRFRANEISCYAEALARVLAAYETLENLPPQAFHKVGGLLPSTASDLAALIQSMVQAGVRNPSVPQVMAEVDQRIDY